MALDLPDLVHRTLHETRALEVSTMARDGTPITWPLVARYDQDAGTFLLTTSIGIPTKVFNIRRNPKVSLLYSDPAGSPVADMPAVLVQGDATAPDEIVCEDMSPIADYWRDQVMARQPSGAFMSRWPIRGLFGWYYMRLLIHVQPRVITWWPDRDFSAEPQRLEVA